MVQGKITLVEKGGRNGFRDNDGINILPSWADDPGSERCKVCGKAVHPDKVSDVKVSNAVFACRECRIKMKEFAENANLCQCPNCDGRINPWSKDRYLRFTGHEDFNKTPKIEICEECFEIYEGL